MFASNTSQASSDATYIEDVFSTYLYTGNGSTQTITNGIDLAGKGGLVWLKPRETASHYLLDTARGTDVALTTNNTSAQGTGYSPYFSFLANGFSLSGATNINNSATPSYTSWTFRKQPKFFDVVTYTGDGAANRFIPHSLGSQPGCVIVKKTSGTGTWVTSIRDATGSYNLALNETSADGMGDTIANGFPNAFASTSTTFKIDSISSNTNVNTSGQTYVAYLFAHNAGGFGLTGTDNVISCGSFTTDASGNATVTLGYEPQWVMWKAASTTGGWNMLDNMRGFTVGGADALLNANSSSAETSIDLGSPTATGFTAAVAGTNATYIYIAIRRGPMKVPTSGTSVFSPNAVNVSNGTQVTTGFPVDMTMPVYRAGGGPFVEDRLRGVITTPTVTVSEPFLRTPYTDAEGVDIGWTKGWNNQGFLMSNSFASADDVFWSFRRAPSFFDEVCYPGTFSAKTVNHNLGVVPELIIFKKRNGVERWSVYSASLNANQSLTLSADWAAGNDDVSNNTRPTSTVFSVSGSNEPLVNEAGYNYVAYLFASCPGVSKVGSYTGNGSSQTINCGFAGGARFVMIKRTDSTGDWYVWDTARGIVAANDPRLSLNSTAAEVTTDDSIDPNSSGFIVNQVTATNINVSSATYIYLAIA